MVIYQWTWYHPPYIIAHSSVTLLTNRNHLSVLPACSRDIITWPTKPQIIDGKIRKFRIKLHNLYTGSSYISTYDIMHCGVTVGRSTRVPSSPSLRAFIPCSTGTLECFLRRLHRSRYLSYKQHRRSCRICHTIWRLFRKEAQKRVGGIYSLKQVE